MKLSFFSSIYFFELKRVPAKYDQDALQTLSNYLLNLSFVIKL